MVHVVITDMAVQDNNELPQLMKDDVKVKQGKTMYTVTQLTPSQLGPRLGARGTNGPTVYHSMPTISVDADSASETSQRYNVIVSSIYSPGVGRAARSSWDLDLGLGGLSMIADETGGECYSPAPRTRSASNPRNLNNQYYLVFLGEPKKNDTLQRIKVWTEKSNSEIAAPDKRLVPGPLDKDKGQRHLAVRRAETSDQEPCHHRGSVPLRPMAGP